MLRHIVLFAAKDKDHIEQTIERLSVLTRIPHAGRLGIARNRKTGQLGNDIDVVVDGADGDRVLYPHPPNQRFDTPAGDLAALGSQ